MERDCRVLSVTANATVAVSEVFTGEARYTGKVRFDCITLTENGVECVAAVAEFSDKITSTDIAVGTDVVLVPEIINCEAAAEIARQVRLRNIGGMIVIDFIDMHDPLHNEEVVDILVRETASDRTRTRVLPMTELGLVQMTRKKTGSELQSLLLVPCPHCHGAASTVSPNFLARKIKSQLVDIFDDPMCSAAIITVNPAAFAALARGAYFETLTGSQLAGKLLYCRQARRSRPTASEFAHGAAWCLQCPITRCFWFEREICRGILKRWKI